jgi:hypothetical protein
MSDGSSLAREVADRQVTMFGMFVGQGCHTTRAALARASGVPESSLREYAAGAAIPFHVVLRLRRFLPAEAINMISEPGDCRLVDVETAATNWDEIACCASSLVGDICDARKDGRITPGEDARLKRRTRELIAEAQSAVEAG